MGENKIDQKVRLFRYLPYGFCSKHATIIVGTANEYAPALRLGDTPEEFLEFYENYKKNIRDQALYLVDKGYANEIKRSCGTPPQTRIFRILTSKGLAILTDAPDQIDTAEPHNAIDIHGSKSDGYFRSNSQAATALRQIFLQLGQSDAPADQAEFATLLSESVMCGDVTPLTYAIALVPQAVINMNKYSSNQRHKIWVLSHINAMFAANGYLTYLDKRQYDTHFAIDGITDNDTYEAYVKKHGLTILALTYYVLKNWYDANPGYTEITQQLPDESQAAVDYWLSTPAFYTVEELPMLATSSTKVAAKGSQQRFFATYLGLATGKNANYAIFHTKPGPFRWIRAIELRAKNELEKAILRMKAQNPQMRCHDNVPFALDFCSTYHQFLAVFASTKAKHQKFKKTGHVTDSPYTSTHIIPVNDSGAFLLWGLMEYSPQEVEEKIKKVLVEQNAGFEYRSERCYPLSYKNTRVFCGHTMDVSKINHALQDHLDGFDFLIACFPDQVSWYKHLFPGKTFL